MKTLRRAIQNFFEVSPREANSFLLVVILFLIGAAFPFYGRLFFPSDPPSVDIQQLEVRKAHVETSATFIAPKALFDPNNASVALWTSTGLDSSLAERIEKYVAKGGKFYKAEDISKIYGLPTWYADTIRNYLIVNKPEYAHKKQKTKVDLPEIKIELNSASALEFQTIHGIGEKLSARIVKYRDLLGGFKSETQLYEVYGLDSTVVQSLIDVSTLSGDIKPSIRLSKGTFKELIGHPYMDKKLTKRVLSWQPYSPTNEEWMELIEKDTLDWSRARPYLQFN